MAENCGTRRLQGRNKPGDHQAVQCDAKALKNRGEGAHGAEQTPSPPQLACVLMFPFDPHKLSYTYHLFVCLQEDISIYSNNDNQR